MYNILTLVKHESGRSFLMMFIFNLCDLLAIFDISIIASLTLSEYIVPCIFILN